jgi:hypothetical protein
MLGPESEPRYRGDPPNARDMSTFRDKEPSDESILMSMAEENGCETRPAPPKPGKEPGPSGLCV